MVDKTIDLKPGSEEGLHLRPVRGRRHDVLDAGVLPGRVRRGRVVAGLPTGCASSLPDATTCMFPGLNSPQAVGRPAPRTPGYWDPAEGRHLARHRGRGRTPKNAQSSGPVDQRVGIRQTPTGPPPSGDTTVSTTRTVRRDVVARYIVAGMGHGTPVKPRSGKDARHRRRLLPRHDLLHLPHDPVLGTRRRSAAVPVPFSVPVAQPVPDHSARGGVRDGEQLPARG